MIFDGTSDVLCLSISDPDFSCRRTDGEAGQPGSTRCPRGPKTIRALDVIAKDDAFSTVFFIEYNVYRYRIYIFTKSITLIQYLPDQAHIQLQLSYSITLVLSHIFSSLCVNLQN